MLSYAAAVGYALFLWWFSTGLILYLDGLPRHTYRWSMLGATALLVLSLLVLWLVRDRLDLPGAYLGFTAGVLIWGWLEMSYFLGVITGPNKAPCPADCPPGRRFLLALNTTLYHELALLVVAGVMIAITWGGANQLGTWTFAILWAMRWSAKLNLFLGVPNLNEDWLPEHVRFVTTYLAKRPMNLLFPVSVTVASMIMALLVNSAMDLPPTGFAGVALMLAATLLALAILEHWFLVLPLQDAALWQWALEARGRLRNGNGATAPETATPDPLHQPPGKQNQA